MMSIGFFSKNILLCMNGRLLKMRMLYPGRFILVESVYAKFHTNLFEIVDHRRIQCTITNAMENIKNSMTLIL